MSSERYSLPVRFGGALIAAGVLALVVLMPPREQRVLVGQPGDALAVGGLSLPSSYLGKPGRWSRGDARIAFRDCPLPAVATLEIATLPERLPDPIEIVANDAQVHRITVTTVSQTIELPVPVRRHPGQTTIAVRSATTTPGAVPQGVFIQNVTLRTGGMPTAFRVRPATWVWLTLAFAAIVFTTSHAVRERAHGRASSWLARGGVAAAVGLAVAAAVIFRSELLAYASETAIACGIFAIAILIVDSDTSWTRRLAMTCERWAWLAFSVGAASAILLLLPEAFLHGRVLSQADMLFDMLPWGAHAPHDAYRAIERPPLGDVPMLVYPFLSFTVSRGSSGVFPLWTASISAGQPFLATYQSALLSPFTWLGMVMPLPYATLAIAAARLIVGGAGMFLFLRRLGLCTWAAAFGGLTYLLNPFSVVWLEHPLAGVPPWLPWMGIAAEGAVTGRALAIAALAIATALTFVGGHPHTGLFVAGFGGAYAIARAAMTTPGRWRALAAVGVALTLGGLLTSLQVLPFLEYLSLSRGVTLRAGYTLNPFIAPVSTLITALVPNFVGHPGWGNYAAPTNYLQQQIYPGIATWVLAPLGVAVGVRRWRTWFFVAAATLAMLTMYGAPGILQLVSVLPLLKAASLPRVGIVAISSLTMLAAFGADAILRRSRVGNPHDESGDAHNVPRVRLVPIVTAVVLLATIGWSVVGRRMDLDRHALLDFTTHWAWLAVFLIIAVCLVIIGRLSELVGPAATGLALVAIVALDLLIFGRGFHPTLPADQVFPPIPEVERIRQDHDVFRVLGLSAAMLPNAAMVYRLQDLRGYDGLGVARYADLLDVVLTYTPFLHVAYSIAHRPLLDLLNVKYVFAPSNETPPDGWSIVSRDGLCAVWRNDRVYPRAWLVDGYVRLEGDAARRALRDASVDGRRVAILEEDPSADERPAAASSAADLGRAAIVAYDDERVAIDTDAPAQRLLVLTDLHYPGWTAQIDDRPGILYRANFAFRAVSVPAGRHHVVFVYRPASVRWGLALTAAALIILAALLVRDRLLSARRS